MSLILPLSVVCGNLAGGDSTKWGVVLVFVLYPLLDLLLGSDDSRVADDVPMTFFQGILYCHFVLHFLALASLFHLVAGDSPTEVIVWATLSTGLNSGVSGAVSAHELVHSPRASDRWLARLLLWSITYLHFETEHIRNHHRNLGTDADPASAPFSRSLIAFIPNAIPRQRLSAWRIEAQRAGSPLFHKGMLRLSLETATLVALWLVLGPSTAIAFFAQCSVAVVLLEYQNFIGHWGLRKAAGEGITPRLSWQSNARLSRYVLLELCRHPDHHRQGSGPFYTLTPCAGAPELPTGYFASFYLVIVHPLWTRIMARRLPAGTSHS
jgi:alkane 1-monooxygenase